MHCKQCNTPIPENSKAKFCMNCGQPLMLECHSCGEQLPQGTKFCMACGTPVGGNTEKPQQAEAILDYCAGSGKVIRPEDEHFKCMECGKLYLEHYRFEDKPICQPCAYDSGMAQTLEKERAEARRIEAEKQQKLEQERDKQRQIEAERQRQLEKERQEQEKRARAEREAAEQKAREAAERQHREQLKLGITEEDWVDIPAGDFIMGSPEHEPERGNHERQHNVTVSAFKLLKTPVTFAMYDAYCDATGKDKPRDEGWGRDKRPVINVSYWDAVDYAQWLSEQTGWHCGLPTEAEWEYACRAGTQTPFSTGQNISAEQANYNGNYPYNKGPKGRHWEKTTPVAHYAPNPWGLYDMHGNVQEWCASEYDEGYSGLEQQDASGDRSNSSARVLRGGCWFLFGYRLRSAARYRLDPDIRNVLRGFRLTRI